MNTPAPTARRRSNLRSPTVSYPTVEAIKAMLGIAPEDTTKDAAIAQILAASLALIENYCGRTFEEGDYVEQFPPLDARDATLILSAYPVAVVRTVTRDDGITVTPLTGWRLFAQSGMVRQESHGHCWCHGHFRMAAVSVDYTGGFPPDAWPADLVDVLLRVFMARWNATGGTGNYADEHTGAGAIKTVTVDGMTLAYDLGDAQAGASVTAGEVPPDLAPYAAELARYRDLRVWGV